MKSPFYFWIKFKREGTSHKREEDLQKPLPTLPTQIKNNKDNEKNA